MKRRSILLPEGVTNELAQILCYIVETALDEYSILNFAGPAQVITHHEPGLDTHPPPPMHNGVHTPMHNGHE